MYGKSVDPKTGEVIKPRLNTGPGLTKQEFRKSCDINEIVARYRKTGMLPMSLGSPGVFADVSNYGDFQTVMNKVRAAQEAFDSLPAKVRSRFGNEPAQLVHFLADPKNRDEAVSLGLIEKKDPVPGPEPAPAPASVPAPVK